MGKIRSKLWTAFKWFRQALVYLIFAPFVGLSALFGLIVISIGYLIRSFEILLTIVGLEPDLGAEFTIEAGVNMLPSFSPRTIRG